MIRSEVKVHRGGAESCNIVTDDGLCVTSYSLSEMFPEIVMGETRSVRISVEIVDDKKEEEKVGSKVVMEKHPSTGTGYISMDGGWQNFLCDFVKDWQPSESRKVKSINFDTPSGVPEVTFCETPRERLKREWEAVKKTAVIVKWMKPVATAIDAVLTEGEKS